MLPVVVEFMQNSFLRNKVFVLDKSSGVAHGTQIPDLPHDPTKFA